MKYNLQLFADKNVKLKDGETILYPQTKVSLLLNDDGTPYESGVSLYEHKFFVFDSQGSAVVTFVSTSKEPIGSFEQLKNNYVVSYKNVYLSKSKLSCILLYLRVSEPNVIIYYLEKGTYKTYTYTNATFNASRDTVTKLTANSKEIYYPVD